MKSIKTKILALLFLSISFTVVTLLVISIFSMKILNERDSNQILEHIGRENANNIDSELQDIQHSVDNVYYYAYDQLEALFGKLYGEAFRKEYLERVSLLAVSEAIGSQKVEVVYFRLTTDIKDDPKGFMYQKNRETGLFEERDLIDVSLYSPDDIPNVGWYYIPKSAKEPIWMDPYYNEDVDMRIISYANPVYVYGRFAGVIGMDVDINVFCEDLKDITVYQTGSAVLFDTKDNILFEKKNEMGVLQKDFTEEETALLNATHNSLNTGHPVEYVSPEGTMKLYACKLMNGMTLCILAPISEINSSQSTLLGYSILFSIIILIATLMVSYFLISKSFRPLKELTEVAKQLSDGNLDVHIHSGGDDEIGQLAKTFGLMATSLKRYFDHFHSLAYTDSLTGLNNKAAYTITKDVIESEVRMGRADFSIIVMDVNNLKTINDTIGHEMGDILLKHVTQCLREAFIGFPLYRIGGDEFCAIINNSSPHELINTLQSITAEMSAKDMSLFHCPYQIAAGAAIYEKGIDQSFDDVFNRADQTMYENKKMLKEKAKMEGAKK